MAANVPVRIQTKTGMQSTFRMRTEYFVLGGNSWATDSQSLLLCVCECLGCEIKLIPEGQKEIESQEGILILIEKVVVSTLTEQQDSNFLQSDDDMNNRRYWNDDHRSSLFSMHATWVKVYAVIFWNSLIANKYTVARVIACSATKGGIP